MTIPAATARQYLKAMGIESWEPKRSSAQEAPAIATPRVAPAAMDNASGSACLACESSVEQFLHNLAVVPVSGVENTNAKMLILLETPVLEADGHELLRSMLNAISIDMSKQNIANLGKGDAAETVQSLTSHMKPAIILVMARYRKSIEELAAHRSGLHEVSWSAAPLVISLHPGALLDDATLKRPAWEDLKRVKAYLDG